MAQKYLVVIFISMTLFSLSCSSLRTETDRKSFTEYDRIISVMTTDRVK